MTRTIWYSLDNMFRVEVPDDATDEQIWGIIYGKFKDTVAKQDVGDFIFIIEEEE